MPRKNLKEGYRQRCERCGGGYSRCGLYCRRVPRRAELLHHRHGLRGRDRDKDVAGRRRLRRRTESTVQAQRHAALENTRQGVPNNPLLCGVLRRREVLRRLRLPGAPHRRDAVRIPERLLRTSPLPQLHDKQRRGGRSGEKGCEAAELRRLRHALFKPGVSPVARRRGSLLGTGFGVSGSARRHRPHISTR